jgi:branched-subunit amino acid transport protein
MEIFVIILGMSVVTYIPRLLPVFMMDKFNLPVWAKRWLTSIPFAALGALVFPDILTVERDMPAIGLVGGLAAAIAAWFRVNVVVVIAISILTVMGLKLLV